MKRILTLSLGLFSTIFSIYAQTNNESYFAEDFENTTRFSQWAVTVLSGTSEWVLESGLPYGNVESAESGSFNASYSSYNYNSDKALLSSPRIDLSSAINPVLRFSYVQPAWSIDQDSLKIYYKSANTNDWTFLCAYGENVVDWTTVSIALPDASTDYYIAFEAISGYGYGTGIDNISIEKGENCLMVSGFEINNIKETSASFRWHEAACNSFEIEYGESGFIIGEGTRLTGIKFNHAIVNGLMSGASYDFYIRSYCSEGISEWSEAIQITTDCNIGVVLPYIESFENTNNPFECWEIAYANLDYHPGNEVIAYDLDSYKGNYSLRFSSYEAGAPYDQFLISPIIDVDEFTEFSFMYKAVEGSSEVFEIGFSENESSSQVSVQWTESITNASDEWKQYTGVIPEGTKRIYIHYATQFGYYLYIDELRIGHPVDCEVVENIVVEDLGLDYATLSWDENESVFAVEYGLAGFEKGTGIKVYTNGESQITIENLIAFTQYSFYGLIDCEGNIIYSDAVDFTTFDECTQISSISLQQVGLSFANIVWDTNNQDAVYNVEFGISGYTIGSGTTIEGLTSPEVYIDNLLTETEYDVYVQAICPQWNSEAPWSVAYSFITDKKDDDIVDIAIEDILADQINEEIAAISISSVEPVIYLCDNEDQVQHINLVVKNIGNSIISADTKVNYIIEDIANDIIVYETVLLPRDLNIGDTFVFSTTHGFSFENEQNHVSISLSANDLIIKNKTVELSFVRLTADVYFVGEQDEVIETEHFPYEIEALVSSNSNHFGIQDSYLWNTGDNYYTAIIDREGEYSFTLSNQYCSITKSVTVKNVDEGNSTDNFQIFPNPSHGIITITNIITGSPVSFSVYDAAGRLVYSETVSGPEQTIDLTNLATGMYSAFFTQEGDSVLKRLFID